MLSLVLIVTVTCSHSLFVQTTSFAIFSCAHHNPLHPPSFLTHRPQLLQRGVPFCSARNRTTSPRKKQQRHKVERADISGGIFLWQIVHTSLRCVCRCRVFVGSGAVVLLALVLRALAISRRPLQILEVRFTNGQLRLSFFSIHTMLSQVLKIF